MAREFFKSIGDFFHVPHRRESTDPYEQLSAQAKDLVKRSNEWAGKVIKTYGLRDVLHQDIYPLLGIAIEEVGYRKGYYKHPRDNRSLSPHLAAELNEFYARKREVTRDVVFTNAIAHASPLSSSAQLAFSTELINFTEDVGLIAEKIAVLYTAYRGEGSSKQIVQEYTQEEKDKLDGIIDTELVPAVFTLISPLHQRPT